MSPESLAESPTLTADLTHGGVLLGTAAYMSPEQARGRPVDKRADIWAFGCVLYEMLTGGRAFAGATSTEILAAIIKEEPEWDALQAEIPTPIRRLLRRCLTKDPRDRLHDIADVRIVLQSLSTEDYDGDEIAVFGPNRAVWRIWLPWGLAAILGTLSFGVLVWNLNRQVRPHVPKRFVIVPPLSNPLTGDQGTDVAISPDGKTIVYVASLHGSTHLCVRSIDQLQVTTLAGTEGGRTPFFSPDGQWLGYYSASDQKLKKVPMTSGPSVPVEICDAAQVFSASWGPNDTIVFGSIARGYGISRVSATGGDPEPLTTPSPEENEISHDSPVLLSDAKTLLFSIRREGGFDEAMIVAQDLATGKRVTLTKGVTNVRYSSTGHIISNKAGTLLAAPFDRARLEVGNWTPVEDGVGVGGTRAAEFALSQEGTLVFTHGWTRRKKSLVWVDRRGEETYLSEQQDHYQQLRISPDGARIAIQVGADQGPSTNIWIYDITRGVFYQWTFEGESSWPVWAPDSQSIALVAEREGAYGIYLTSAEEYGIGLPLWTSKNNLQLSSWSPDGDWLAFVERHPETRADLWIFSLQEGTASPLLTTSANENSPMFSPDGKWISYVSDESGRAEIYVRPFVGAGGNLRISTDGGTRPSWALSGKELFYRRGDELFTVAVSTNPAFRKPGQPRALVEKENLAFYDVHPDGTRFLVSKYEIEDLKTLEIRVVLEWAEELKRLVPAD